MENTDDALSVVQTVSTDSYVGVIKSKGTQKISIERRCTSIAHATISACRPRSFISSILLSIAVYINRRYGSRELINILSSMSFSDDDKEVQRLGLYSSTVSGDKPSYHLSGFSPFVLDNADFKCCHHFRAQYVSYNDIVCVIPAGDQTRIATARSTNLTEAEVVGNFGKIAIQPYKKLTKLGLNAVSMRRESSKYKADIVAGPLVMDARSA